MNLNVLIARIRVPLIVAGGVLLIVGAFVGAVFWVGLLVVLAGAACYLFLGRVRTAPRRVQPPVTGRWMALNSPANRVPSHGMHAYGQTYAVDLAYEPADGSRPGFGWWPVFRRPDRFPGFGQPVLAPAAGTVVRVHQRERDHLSRNSWPGLAYLIIESVREFSGPSRIFGNHIVLDLGDGTYAALAHLRRRSVRVSVGDRVQPGQHLADCGNSGNSTEPHLHVQLMDHPRALIAAGLPMEFETFEVDGAQRTGLPRNHETFVVAPAQVPDQPSR